MSGLRKVVNLKLKKVTPIQQLAERSADKIMRVRQLKVSGKK